MSIETASNLAHGKIKPSTLVGGGYKDGKKVAHQYAANDIIECMAMLDILKESQHSFEIRKLLENTK